MKQRQEKTTKEKSNFFREVTGEFKEFISRGNVIDLAVGVIVGSAFSAIITSLVNDIVMPFVGVLLGGFDFSSLVLSVGDANIRYGAFLQAVLNFLVIAICIFIFVKTVNGLKNVVSPDNVQQVEDKSAKKKEDEQIQILKEIREELRKK